MDKIGEKLRNARELRKLTIKEISKETNISSKYLEALEAEEFDKIPGETYLLGFLRMYAESLKLDGDEIIQDYKGYLDRQIRRNIPPIVLRHQHAPHPRPLRGEQLRAHAAYGQHVAGQRDLAGHGQIGRQRLFAHDRQDRRDHGHTGARPVLGGCGLSCPSRVGGGGRPAVLVALRAAEPLPDA